MDQYTDTSDVGFCYPGGNVEGWTSARTAGDGSPVSSLPGTNAIDTEAETFPLKDPSVAIGLPGINTPIAPPSGPQGRDWTSGGAGPSNQERVGGPERR